jgi:hypothetical protein
MRKHLLILLLMMLCLHSRAQTTVHKDTSLKSTTIEIIQAYKPEVQSAPKPEYMPVLPPADTTKSTYNYEAPEQPLYYPYHSLPLKPLALTKDSTADKYVNYVKFGLGNLSTIFLDAGIASIQGPQYTSAINIHHFSQKGSIANQSQMLTTADADVSYHTTDRTYNTSLSLLRNEYHYYGYDHDLYHYGSSDVQQVFSGINAGVNMVKQQPVIEGIYLQPSVNIGYYADKHGARETTLAYGLSGVKRIDSSLLVTASVNGAFTRLHTSAGNNGNGYFQLTPLVTYHNDNWVLQAGIYPTIAKNSAYTLPQITFSITPFDEHITYQTGLLSELHRNTYQELSTNNPFMYNIYDTKQCSTYELYAGLKDNIGQHISYTVRGSWKQFYDLAQYIDTIGDGKQFNVVYNSKAQATILNGKIRYQTGNSFSAGMEFTWTNYFKSTMAHVWQMPGIVLKGDVMYQVTPKILGTGYICIMDDIYALQTGNASKKLKGVYDIGIQGSYAFSERFSGYININNILNNKSERWSGYTSYGTNVVVGVRYKF